MHSEVRLDRHATHTVPTACDVLGAVSQPERLPRLDAWGHAAPHTADGCTAAGADPRHSRRTQGRLRQPENGQRTAWTWVSSFQAASRTTDAGPRHPGAPQAAVQGDDGREAP